MWEVGRWVGGPCFLETSSTMHNFGELVHDLWPATEELFC